MYNSLVGSYPTFGEAAVAMAKMGYSPSLVSEDMESRGLRVLNALTDPNRKLTPSQEMELTDLFNTLSEL